MNIVCRILLCVALCVAGTLPVLPPASADVIDYSSVDQAGFDGQVAGCLSQYAQPGNDPANVLPVIKAPGAENVYIIYKKTGGNFEVKHNGIEGTNIGWNPGDTTEYEPGVPRLPCISLYHELVHAHDEIVGSLGDAYCGKTGVPIREVRAIEAENQLRAKLGVKPRTTHGETYADAPDTKISVPPKLSDCDNEEQRKARESGNCKDVPVGGCSREDANPANPKKIYKDGTPADGSGSAAGGEPAGGTGGDSAGGPETPGADVPVATDSGGGPAHAIGDPHLQTLDGRLIDLMAVGEFMLASSSDNGLQVQGRFSPLYGSRTISVVSAVAIKFGDDRLQLTLDSGRILLKHNGRDLNVLAEPDAGRFGQFSVAYRPPATGAYSQDAYTIELADGSHFSVELNGASLAVFFTPDDSYRGQMTGLLGNFNSDPADDLRSSTGTIIPATPGAAPGYEALYRQFGDSWRVTDANSLFTYAGGQNTGTFTDTTFPDREAPAADFTASQQLGARDVCAGVGVSDPALVDACMLDLLVTGQPTYANTVALAQNVNDAAAAAAGSAAPPADPNAVPAGQTLRDGAKVTGRITGPAQSLVYNLELGNATRFFVADWRGLSDGCDQAFTVDLVTEAKGNVPCTGQQVAFATPNVAQPHQLQVSALDGFSTGNFSFTVVTAKPRQLTARPGSTVRGTLDVRGREDRYELPAGRTEVSVTSEMGCDVEFFAGVYDLTLDDMVALGDPLCRHDLGPYELPDPGHRYAVVVSSPDLKTGDYQLTVH